MITKLSKQTTTYQATISGVNNTFGSVLEALQEMSRQGATPSDSIEIFTYNAKTHIKVTKVLEISQ